MLLFALLAMAILFMMKILDLFIVNVLKPLLAKIAASNCNVLMTALVMGNAKMVFHVAASQALLKMIAL